MTNFRIEDSIIGSSGAIRAVRERVLRLAPTRLPVLIQGPTGAGKELVADALHRLSCRAGSPVVVNICAIAETMFEATLFGHVRGSFSGAVGDAAGYLMEAHNSSLFLDEISGLEYGAQAKLLRAVELGRFRPVGAKSDSISDFRVIAATNENLEKLVQEGRFRLDLLQRLRAAVIRVPGLDERGGDIRILTSVFATRVAIDGQPRQFSESALRFLEQRTWPGNVRELMHVVECSVAFTDGDVVNLEIVEDVASHLDSTTSLPDADALDRQRLLTILEEGRWNLVRAADLAGVHRVTLWRWMRRFGIARPRRIAIGELRGQRSRDFDGDVAAGCAP
jgi:DNA-binding NtrC family response regulator